MRRPWIKSVKPVHHEYDEKAKQLVYVKGREGTCRYCHQQVTEENRSSFRLAAHQDCVGCHQERTAKNKTAGPVQCAGCHDAGQQALIEKVTSLPRMEMKQPDAVFVQTGLDPAVEVNMIRMPRVPFNHKGHERTNDTCRTCHHASLVACSECHSVDGKKEGAGVKLEQAMHSRAGAGCIGCHAAEQAEKTCAGCHAMMSPLRKTTDATCRACHMMPTGDGEPLPKAPKAAAAMADQLLKSRKPTKETLSKEDIPETVTIKSLADKYQPVALPHRKIVLKLAADIRDNGLANYFHTDPATLCQGCHHNSPLAKKPPRCGSCHGTPFDNRNPFRPGLMAAYHQQCMGCHHEMGILKPASMDCTACHKEK